MMREAKPTHDEQRLPKQLLGFGRHFISVLCTILLVAVFAPSTQAEDGKQFEITMHDAFIVNFRAAFAYDVCGVPELGQKKREVLRSLVNKCDMPDADKQSVLKAFATDSESFAKILNSEKTKPHTTSEADVDAPTLQDLVEFYDCEGAWYKPEVGRLKWRLEKYALHEMDEYGVMNLDPALCSLSQ